MRQFIQVQFHLIEFSEHCKKTLNLTKKFQKTPIFL